MGRPPSTLDPRRRWLFRALLAIHITACAVLVTVLGLFVVETHVALAPSFTAGGFFELDGDRYRAAAVTMPPSSFLRDKPAGTLRVFVLGGSAVMGSPYVVQTRGAGDELFGLLQIPNEGGLPSWTEAWLEQLDPRVEVEVVNAAMGGQGLASCRAALEEILQIGAPDLVVVMSGNNEREASSLVAGSFVLDSTLELDSEVRRLGERYADQLDAMIAAAQVAGCPLWLLTVPSNLRDWEPAGEPPFDQVLVEGLVSSGQHWRCVQVLRAAQPERDAQAAYWLARCLEGQGQLDEALSWYLVARDRDPAFLRVRSEWNQRVRERSDQAGVRVLDLEAALNARAEGLIPGREAFLDYCHMTLASNRWAGRWLASEIAEHVLGLGPTALEGCSVPVPSPEILRRLGWLLRIKAWRIRLASTLHGVEDQGARLSALSLEQDQVQALADEWAGVPAP